MHQILYAVLETFTPLVLDDQFPNLMTGLLLLEVAVRDREEMLSRPKEDMSTQARIARLQMLQMPLRDPAGEHESVRGMRRCPSD